MLGAASASSSSSSLALVTFSGTSGWRHTSVTHVRGRTREAWTTFPFWWHSRLLWHRKGWGKARRVFVLERGEWALSQRSSWWHFERERKEGMLLVENCQPTRERKRDIFDWKIQMEWRAVLPSRLETLHFPEWNEILCCEGNERCLPKRHKTSFELHWRHRDFVLYLFESFDIDVCNDVTYPWRYVGSRRFKRLLAPLCSRWMKDISRWRS